MMATTEPYKARQIMGQNFFGIEEAVEHFEADPSPSEIAMLTVIPFSEEELNEKKGSHILVAFIPMSLLDLRGRVDSEHFSDQSWYIRHPFARERGEPGWHLILKTQVLNSENKTWQSQQILLNKTEQVPISYVLCYAIIGHFLATGTRLFDEIRVRCSDLDSDGWRVCVGFFCDSGLSITYSRPDSKPVKEHALAAEQK